MGRDGVRTLSRVGALGANTFGQERQWDCLREWQQKKNLGLGV